MGKRIIISEDENSESEVVWEVRGVRKDQVMIMSDRTDDDGNAINEVDKIDLDPKIFEDIEVEETEDYPAGTIRKVGVTTRDAKGHYIFPKAYGQKEATRKIKYIKKKERKRDE